LTDVSGRHRTGKRGGFDRNPAVLVAVIAAIIALALLFIFATSLERWGVLWLATMAASITAACSRRSQTSTRWLAIGSAVTATAGFVDILAGEHRWHYGHLTTIRLVGKASGWIAIAVLAVIGLMWLRARSLRRRQPGSPG
jgi:hypothetical protein